MLLAAFFGIPIQFLLQFHGLALTTVSHASLMVGAMPVLLAAAAATVRRRAAGLDRLAGAVRVHLRRGHGGAGRQPRDHRARNAYARGRPAGDCRRSSSALAWILLSKKLMETHSPPVVTAYTIYSGTLMLLVWVFGLSAACAAHAREAGAHAVRPCEPDRLDCAGHQRRCCARPPPRYFGTGASIMCRPRAPESF